MSSKNCSTCRNWVDGCCRADGPVAFTEAGGVWPKTAATDWCFSYRPSIVTRGVPRKFTDPQLIELVATYDRPVQGDELRMAVKRTELVTMLKIEFGVSTTPALRRIEKLVRRGLLVEGDNPWPRPYPTPGVYIWLGKSDDTPEPAAVTKAHFVDIVRRLAPDAGSAMSLRAIVKACALEMPMSVTTASKRMTALIAQGLAARNEQGYHATEAAS